MTCGCDSTAYCFGCGNCPHRGCTCIPEGEMSTEPDWTRECDNCGETPIVPMTGLCGPCTFGEADTAGGNW